MSRKGCAVPFKCMIPAMKICFFARNGRYLAGIVATTADSLSMRNNVSGFGVSVVMVVLGQLYLMPLLLKEDSADVSSS